jgi:GNAT superfamily N-acetyltransferase
VWLLVDGELAGEMYGLPVIECGEEIPDVEPTDFYIGKITILPIHQGKGLGRLLFAYTLGMLGDTFARISWHTTSSSMDALSDFLGAKIGAAHLNWFKTGEAARLRYLDTP